MNRLLCILAALLAVACASSEDGPGDGDAGGSPAEAGTADAGPPDAGEITCPTGQHRCGGGCIDDRPNEPAEGCRYGCGEPCPAPEGGTAVCTEDGACDFECEAPFVREPDGCTCAPATCEALGETCGEHDDGCGGTVDCGECGCEEDAGEPNESVALPHALPAFSDAPDTSMTFDTFNLSDDGDEDWFRFEVSDDFDAGNPQIRITLDAIPVGSDYDLGAWYVCAGGGDDSSCLAGTTDNTVGNGCVSSTSGESPETVEIDTNCSGSDDSGAVLVRVHSTTWTPVCTPYTLAVSVR